MSPGSHISDPPTVNRVTSRATRTETGFSVDERQVVPRRKMVSGRLRRALLKDANPLKTERVG
jgi:hypothetical protein